MGIFPYDLKKIPYVDNMGSFWHMGTFPYVKLIWKSSYMLLLWHMGIFPYVVHIGEVASHMSRNMGPFGFQCITKSQDSWQGLKHWATTVHLIWEFWGAAQWNESQLGEHHQRLS